MYIYIYIYITYNSFIFYLKRKIENTLYKNILRLLLVIIYTQKKED